MTSGDCTAQELVEVGQAASTELVMQGPVEGPVEKPQPNCNRYINNQTLTRNLPVQLLVRLQSYSKPVLLATGPNRSGPVINQGPDTLIL